MDTYYYSHKKMFKYKINEGVQYEANYHMSDIHRALDLWVNNRMASKSSDYTGEIGIYFLDLVTEFDSSYEDVLAMASI